LTAEVFVPDTRNGRGVVWVVSSGGASSREQTLQTTFERRLVPLLQHGYTVFAVMHGSAPRFQVEDFIQDVRRAVRFVRYSADQYGLDANRLGIVGSSSGGAIALMVALDAQEGDPTAADPIERVSSRANVVAAFFAPTDFESFGDQNEDVVAFMRQQYGVVDPSFQFFDVDSAGVAILVQDDAERAQRLRAVSPVTYVTPDDPPVLLIHGDQDRVIPLRQSERLYERLGTAGVIRQLIVREGRGHAWNGWESDAELVTQWLDTHLGEH
jgi:acetyl esterase/lipase